MKRRSIAILAAAALLAAPPVAAQEWHDLRDLLLEMIGDVVAQEGYVYAGFAHEGALRQGESEDVTIRLGVGLDFMVVGECDTDCEDLDLALYDGDGNAVDTDFEVDDFPIVMTSPPDDPITFGVYRLRVTMAACGVEPCYYAVQTFARPRGGAV